MEGAGDYRETVRQVLAHGLCAGDRVEGLLDVLANVRIIRGELDVAVGGGAIR